MKRLLLIAAFIFSTNSFTQSLWKELRARESKREFAWNHPHYQEIINAIEQRDAQAVAKFELRDSTSAYIIYPLRGEFDEMDPFKTYIHTRHDSARLLHEGSTEYKHRRLTLGYLQLALVRALDDKTKQERAASCKVVAVILSKTTEARNLKDLATPIFHYWTGGFGSFGVVPTSALVLGRSDLLKLIELARTKN